MDSDPRLQKSYGPYVLERRLGEGGMGTVYVGVHSRTGRSYAVKLLRPETPESTLEQQGIARFRREARALSELRHANVVAIHDFDVSEKNEPYLVMDLLDGEPLSDRIERTGGLSIGEASRYFEQLTSALAAVHDVGVIHRDVKPSNVLIARIPGGDERATLIDFGLAKQLGSVATTVTAPDTALGTPAYMAPEQARGQNVDQRTDVYALGILLYEMIAGRPPFIGPTPTAILAQTLVDPPPPLTSMTDAELPAGIDAVIDRALAKDPIDRYASARELGDAFAALLRRGGRKEAFPETRALLPARRDKRVVWPWIVGGLTLLGGAAMWVGTRGETLEQPAPPRATAPPATVEVEERALEPIAPEPVVEAPPPQIVAAIPTPVSDVRPLGRRRALPAPAQPAAAPSPPPLPPVAPSSADPLDRARAFAARRQWRDCVAALASQPSIERNALDVFLICADHARDRSALERGCREVERLLLFDHAWHQRCQVEILGGGRLPPPSTPSNLSGDDRLEHEAQAQRDRGDFAGCARTLEPIQRSYPGMMMRLDCAELSGDTSLLRRACRRYIDARIPAQSRFNPICEDVLRAAASP